MIPKFLLLDILNALLHPHLCFICIRILKCNQNLIFQYFNKLHELL